MEYGPPSPWKVSFDHVLSLLKKSSLPALNSDEIDTIAALFLNVAGEGILRDDDPNAYGGCSSSQSGRLEESLDFLYAERLLMKESEAWRFGCVLNLDKVGGPGTHWVGYYLQVENGELKPQYIDSYGEPAEDKVVVVTNKILRKPLYWSNYDFQPMGTNACGWYALYFLFQLWAEQWEKRWDAFPTLVEGEKNEKGEPYANDKALHRWFLYVIPLLIERIQKQL